MPTVKKIAKLTSVALFWLLVWWVVSLLVDNTLLFPDPWTVASHLFALMGEGAFWLITASSVGRILLGVLAAVVLGAALAVATAFCRPLEELLSPLLTVVKSTPVASFIVLALIWLGRDVIPSFISVLMVTPVVWGNVSAGIKSTDPALLQMSRAYGVGRGRIFLRVYVPSVMPHFFSAIRTSLGLAWKAGIAAEVLTVPKNSIGKMIYESKLNMETADLFAWTFAVILLSLLIERLIVALIARLCRRAFWEVGNYA